MRARDSIWTVNPILLVLTQVRCEAEKPQQTTTSPLDLAHCSAAERQKAVVEIGRRPGLYILTRVTLQCWDDTVPSNAYVLEAILWIAVVLYRAPKATVRSVLFLYRIRGDSYLLHNVTAPGHAWRPVICSALLPCKRVVRRSIPST